MSEYKNTSSFILKPTGESAVAESNLAEAIHTILVKAGKFHGIEITPLFDGKSESDTLFNINIQSVNGPQIEWEFAVKYDIDGVNPVISVSDINGGITAEIRRKDVSLINEAGYSTEEYIEFRNSIRALVEDLVIASTQKDFVAYKQLEADGIPYTSDNPTIKDVLNTIVDIDKMKPNAGLLEEEITLKTGGSTPQPR